MRGGACTICGAAAQRVTACRRPARTPHKNINTTAARATGVARIAEVGTRRGVEDACVCSIIIVFARMPEGPQTPLPQIEPYGVQGQGP